MSDEKNVLVIPLVRIEAGTDVHEPGPSAKPFRVTEQEAKRLCAHVPPSVRRVGGGEDEDDDGGPRPLEAFKRGELDSLAVSMGIEDPDKLGNKTAVIAAIREKRAAAGADSFVDDEE